MTFSEGMFSKVFHLSPDGISITRLQDGVYLAVNEGFCRILGFSADEVLGHSSVSADLAHWADPADRAEFVAQVQAKQEVTNLVANFRRKDRTVIQGLVSARVLEIDGVECLMSVTRDLSETTLLKAQLSESERDFRIVFDNLADAVFVLTMDGRIVNANRTACQRLGYGFEELTTMQVSRINAPESLGDVRRKLETLANVGYLRARTVHLTRDGLKIPTELHSKVIQIHGEKRILAIARDLTDRVGSEAALEDSERRYRMIFENSGTSNSIFDLNCRLMLQNSQSRRELGRVGEDTVGLSVEDLFGAERGAVIRQRMMAVQDTGTSTNHETTFTLPSGPRTYQSSYQPVLDDQGHLAGIQIVSRDVTDSRLLDEKLRQTVRMEAIGVLAGGIAHDFNNLLAGLSGNLDLAKMHLANGKTSEALERLEKAGQVFQRAKALTKQLLTFSKGGTPIQQPRLLSPLLKEWGEFVFSGSNVTLQTDIAPDLWLCECDDMQIGQAVDNLLINARQVSPAGGRVTLRAENCLREEPLIAIHVIDQGPGVPEDLRAKIFDPFFTTKTTGTGLGLASALSIVRQHKGWIDVVSQPGQGSTFSLYLPATPTQRAIEHPKSPIHFSGEGLVLVMDDEAALRDAVGAMLESLGFQVLSAADGIEAVQLFEQARQAGRTVNLALLDLTIRGGLDGVQTAHALHELDAKMPLLAMSGYSEDYYPETLALSGFEGLLSKPFTLQELGAQLRKLFPAEPPRRPAD
jgi:PAS domain S-box-containing protein